MSSRPRETCHRYDRETPPVLKDESWQTQSLFFRVGGSHRIRHPFYFQTVGPTFFVGFLLLQNLRPRTRRVYFRD